MPVRARPKAQEETTVDVEALIRKGGTGTESPGEEEKKARHPNQLSWSSAGWVDPGRL